MPAWAGARCPLSCRVAGGFPLVGWYAAERCIEREAVLRTPEPGHLLVRSCPDCGIEWLDAEITWATSSEEAYLGLAIQYDGDPDGERRRAAAFLDVVHRYRTPPGRLLDLGCGLGTLLEVARARGWQVSGSDLVAGAIHRLREAGMDAHAGPLTDLALPRASFDAVTAFCVLPHVGDPLVEVSRICTLLRPGRIFVAEMPANGLYRRAARLLARLGLDWGVRHVYYPGHRYAFTERSARVLMEHAGLEVLEVTPYHAPHALSSRRLVLRGGPAGRAAALLVPIAAWLSRLLRLPNHMVVVAVRRQRGSEEDHQDTRTPRHQEPRWNLALVTLRR